MKLLQLVLHVGGHIKLKRNDNYMQNNYTPYKTGRDALTSGEVEKLLNSFDSIQEKAIIQLAVSTGLRRVDVVNIKHNNLDLKKGTLTYYEHKKRRTRTINIPSNAAIHTLSMHLNSCKKSKWLFPSPLNTKEDKHISDRQIYDIFNEHLDIIKIKRRPFHALRATCIKLCEGAGWRDIETAELVGDTVKVIQEHYQVPSDSQMKKLANDNQII